MNKIIFALSFISLSLGIQAQQPNIVSSHFQDYAENKEFTKITISDVLFQLANHIEAENEDEEEFKEAVSKIKGMVILACDSCTGNERSMYLDVNSRTPKSFEELMLVEDEDADIRFSIKEESGVINEMLVTVGGENVFVMVDIWGEIDLKNIRKLTQAFDVEGMQSFDPKTAIASRKVNLYPNPVAVGENVTLDLPEELLGSVVKIYSLDGKLLEEFTANSTMQSISTKSHKENILIINVFDGNRRFYTERIIVVN